MDPQHSAMRHHDRLNRVSLIIGRTLSALRGTTTTIHINSQWWARTCRWVIGVLKKGSVHLKEQHGQLKLQLDCPGDPIRENPTLAPSACGSLFLCRWHHHSNIARLWPLLDALFLTPTLFDSRGSTRLHHDEFSIRETEARRKAHTRPGHPLPCISPKESMSEFAFYTLVILMKSLL